MQNSTIQKLARLNQEFYNSFAEVFSASRGRTEPGFERIIAHIEPESRVLDLGCGQGRLACLLPPRCAYVGVDYSKEMLDVAQRTIADCNPPAEFIQGDLLNVEDWKRWCAGQLYDWVILRAVLHHVPGYTNRLAILKHAARCLAPSGYVAMANWQFLNIPRLRRRLCDWGEIGLTDNDVEPGDYLLDWQREGRGLRYVHLLDESETTRLAHDAGLHLTSMFRADGHTNDLTLYGVLGG